MEGANEVPGGYRIVDSRTPVYWGVTSDWAYCNLDPIVVDIKASAIPPIVTPSPDDPTRPLRTCDDLTSGRIPLEDELTEDGSAYESSWAHYLDLAQSAADHADRLGEEVIHRGLEIDRRTEDAVEALERICGGPLDLDGLFGGFGATRAGACALPDDAACPTPGYTCQAGQCVLDPMRVLEDKRGENPTAARLYDCLADDGVVEFASLGSQTVCLWRNASTRHDICDPDALATTSAHDPTRCPYLPDEAGCVNPGLKVGYELVIVDTNLDIFEADASGATREEGDAAYVCEAIRGLRNPMLASIREALANEVLSRGFFGWETVRRHAARVGWRALPYDYGAITIDNHTVWGTGDSFADTNPQSTTWPCVEYTGIHSRELECDDTLPPEAQPSLFCAYTGSCGAGGSRSVRAQFNNRMFGAVLSSKVLTGTPMCQRRMRQLPLDISVAMGGEWFPERAQTIPSSWS